MLALLFGLWVVLVYGMQRNAMPYFGGDEWLPQLVSIGISCGLMAALLVCLPGLDVHVYSSIHRQLGAGAHGRPPTVATFLRHRAMAQLFSGFLLVMLVFCTADPTGAGIQLLVVGIVVLGVLAEVGLAGSGVDKKHWRPWPGWGEAAHKLFGLQALQLGLLVWLWLLMGQRLELESESKIRAAFTLVVVALAVYRASFLWFFLKGGSMRTRLHFLLALVAVISATFAPEILRVAGLANLPGARLQVDLATARTVVGHLQGADKASSLTCERPQQDDPGECTVRLKVDVVSRVGSTYLLAAAGTLADRKAGACAGVHVQSLIQQRDKFSCVQLPRDAVRAVLR